MLRELIMAKIILIEDDPDIVANVTDWLQDAENHLVEVAQDGREALDHLRFYNYDLIILDWDLPQITGLEICHDFRKRGGNTPILFLTGKRELINKEAGFDAGADDYLTKPFSVRELAARVRALLRRPPSVMKGGSLICRHVVMDPLAARVTKDGAEVALNAKEYALLEFLLRHPGQLFSAEALLDRVWASDSDATTEAITTTVKRLRKKLDKDGEPSMITTVHGLGYRLEDKEQQKTQA